MKGCFQLSGVLCQLATTGYQARFGGENDFFQPRTDLPTGVALTSLPWIRQRGQRGTGPNHRASLNLALGADHSISSSSGGIPSPPSSLFFRPRRPRIPGLVNSLAKLRGQAAPPLLPAPLGPGPSQPRPGHHPPWLWETPPLRPPRAPPGPLPRKSDNQPGNKAAQRPGTARYPRSRRRTPCAEALAPVLGRDRVLPCAEGGSAWTPPSDAAGTVCVRPFPATSQPDSRTGLGVPLGGHPRDAPPGSP